MPQSNRKKRLNTTIDDDLLKQFKILAVRERALHANKTSSAEAKET
jgi:hypothetical protein